MDITSSINRVVQIFSHTQFAVADVLRRAQGDALGASGLNPSECPYKVTASAVNWRLRDYGGGRASPLLLIVAAPIKRAYIWDIAPSVSPIRYCLGQGIHVYLLDWKPTSSIAGNDGIAEHSEAILDCVERICEESRGRRPFLIGHSLGGTLAAISCALAPRSVRGLVLLSAPLCFQPGKNEFRDALISLLPSVLFDAGSYPGSLLSHVTVMASPHAFMWSRLKDAALSVIDPHALEIHARVERWALDEVAVSGKLFRQMIDWLYRENLLCRGILNIAETRASPMNLSTPVLAVVNAEDEVAPLASVKPFMDALSTKDATILVCPSEVGVCLQHVGILVGREALNNVWPEIISWLHSHG